MAVEQIAGLDSVANFHDDKNGDMFFESRSGINQFLQLVGAAFWAFGALKGIAVDGSDGRGAALGIDANNEALLSFLQNCAIWLCFCNCGAARAGRPVAAAARRRRRAGDGQGGRFWAMP